MLLAVLILLNMTVIFLFSAQNGVKSNATSGKVTETVAEVTVKDFESKPDEEKQQIVKTLHPFVRKAAHMAEFGSLGALTLSFLFTFRGGLLWQYLASLGFTFLYACTDELHQMLSEARGPRFTDVLIDLSGAVITCTILLAVCVLIRKKRGTLNPRIVTTTYHITAPAAMPRRIVLASDLHGEPWERIAEMIRAQKPDMILIPGDVADDGMLAKPSAGAYDFLRACAEIAPTYYSLGNHEIKCYHKGNPFRHPHPVPLSNEVRTRIRQTGVVFLDDDCVRVRDLTVCGIGSGIDGKKNEPDQALIEKFDAQPGCRILLCHHPEYFVPYIQRTSIELTVSGHAHGGQWRFFGRGVYAPGQGLFPKYTAGVIDGRCVISRGLSNHEIYPRFFNPRELVVIECETPEAP